MIDLLAKAQEFDKLIQNSSAVTILSHIHPDADAIGTALGIYEWLKERRVRVEVANASEDIPRYLDFLPSFHRIKKKIDFDDSLIIACDSGSIDRLGFDVGIRKIVNIDHHPTNTHFGALNIVDPEAVSSSEVAYRLLSSLGTISARSATAFYAALASDTRNFTVGKVTRKTFDLAGELIDKGVNVAYISSQMHHRRSLASLRILGVAIESLRLYKDAKVAIMIITREDRKKCGAKGSDLDGVVDYARSLVTAEVAALIVERKDEIKVSLRSKGIDVSIIAQEFGGGGHREAAGYEVSNAAMEECVDRLLEVIDKKEILS